MNERNGNTALAHNAKLKVFPLDFTGIAYVYVTRTSILKLHQIITKLQQTFLLPTMCYLFVIVRMECSFKLNIMWSANFAHGIKKIAADCNLNSF